MMMDTGISDGRFDEILFQLERLKRGILESSYLT